MGVAGARVGPWSAGGTKWAKLHTLKECRRAKWVCREAHDQFVRKALTQMRRRGLCQKMPLMLEFSLQ